MSSTIVYQGSQSCFEVHHTENKPLRLKLAAPKPVRFESTNTKEVKLCDENPDSGGWNFLQSLSNYSQSPKKTFNTESVHPSLKLSQKSLELCTENLGSETGSDDTGDIDIMSFTSMQSRSVKSSTTTKTQGHVSLAKKTNTRNFPPPLTTITGLNALQVRPHREGGRLIMKAVKAPSSRACFEAERSHGRLQLRFLKNCEFFYDKIMSSEDNDDDINIEESKTEDHNTNDQAEDIFKEDEFEKSIANNNNIVDRERNGGYMKKDMDGIRQDVEVVMGKENFQRHTSRCKESGSGNNNKGICNWDAFWVAT